MPGRYRCRNPMRVARPYRRRIRCGFLTRSQPKDSGQASQKLIDTLRRRTADSLQSQPTKARERRLGQTPVKASDANPGRDKTQGSRPR